jgi:TRAP transporter 4TM/12TM fusion protein
VGGRLVRPPPLRDEPALVTPARPGALETLAGLSARALESRAPLATVLAMAAAVAMAVSHMAQLSWFYLPAGQFKNLHLSFALTLAFLGLWEATPTERRARRLAYAALALITLIPFLYIHVEYEALIQSRRFMPNRTDTLIAVLLLVLAGIAAWRQWGWTIPALAFLALLYGAFGYLLPGEILFHGGISFGRLIGYTSIPYFQGLLGTLTELSAGTIFMFMVFAGVLKVTGGIDFIIKAAYAIGGRSRAGPAQVAVVSSGFMGMLSGSTVANVASTGALTIPMMKRFGFKPEFAAAVEAVASTGGQFMPPVMGLAAFLIVGITGIPYLEVMAAALFPALIFYAYLMVAVHIRAAKIGLDAKEQMTREGGAAGAALKEAFRDYGHLLIGIAVLIWLLVVRMPPGAAALWATLALLALDAAKKLIVHRTNPRLGVAAALTMIVRGLEDGARTGAAVATVIAVINILIEILAVTGFAQKLSNTMLALAGGELWPLLLIAGGTCLAFGLGLPTSAAYILVALLGAPALAELGVPLLAAHLFVFYFANMSGLTPPVAVTALVGANIAGAKFLETALTAVRLGLPGFLLPFLIVVRPEIIGLDATLPEQLFHVLVAGVAVIALNVALEGFLLVQVALIERALLLAVAIALLWPGLATTLVGAALLAGIGARQVLAHRGATA